MRDTNLCYHMLTIYHQKLDPVWNKYVTYYIVNDLQCNWFLVLIQIFKICITPGVAVITLSRQIFYKDTDCENTTNTGLVIFWE